MLHFILTLLTASMTLKYIPIPWRYVTCVFLPKAGKTDYTERSSFRPVSLMSFLLKSGEKMNLWRMEETALVSHPLHPKQFGARKGVGTDNALSTVVDTVEKAIMNNQYALGLFMDIKGAFNNLTYQAILTAMESKNVDKTIIEWYKHFLESRIVTSTLGTSTEECKCTRGCPQGGCLSSTLWGMAFDGFLESPNDSAIRPHGFVDDGCLIMVGADPATLYNRMNEAITQASHWATSCGLEFCPKKTQALLFTYKNTPVNKDTGEPFALRMCGIDIPNVRSTKFLGVTLDKKLNFHEHITKRIKACRLALLRVRPILGHTWSPSPIYTRWLYTSAIVPMMSYGSAVWIKAIDEQGIREKLSSLQRMGLLSITPVRRGTPTASLELLYNIPPLHILLRERAEMTFLRLGSLQQTHWIASHQPQIKRGKLPKKPRPRLERRGHLAHIRRDLPNLGDDDTMAPISNFDKNYRVFTAEGLPESLDRYAIYTDGSKHDDDHTGSGTYIRIDGSPHIGFAERLPNHATVFQAELRAIQMTAQHLQHQENQVFHFHVDSLSALQAINASHITSKTVHHTVTLLNSLGTKNLVILQKIKGHDPNAESDGNDMADKMANWGADLPEHMITCHIHETRNMMKNHIKNKSFEAWTEHWKQLPEHRQSKFFMKGPNPKMWADLKYMKKKKLSSVVRFITGHCFMRRHQTCIQTGKRGTCADQDPGSRCRLCENGEETPQHLITTCDRLALTRHTIFSKSQMVMWALDRPPPEWSKELLDFIDLDIIQSLDCSEDRILRSSTLNYT